MEIIMDGKSKAYWRKSLSFQIPIVTVVLFFSSLFASPVIAAQQTNRSYSVEQYLEMLNSKNWRNRTRASKYISMSIVKNKQLFDLMSDRLIKGYIEKMDSRAHIDEMSWYCKALISSGMEEYKKIIEEVALNAINRKLAKSAWTSLGLFEAYKKRNEIVAQEKDISTALAPDVALYMAMLKLDNLRLKREGARRIVKTRPTDQRVYEIVEKELLKGMRLGPDNRDRIDVLAWLCKALAASGMERYRQTLKKVISTTDNEKLKEHAIVSLEEL